jgi:PAS domain S-box-containing protein
VTLRGDDPRELRRRAEARLATDAPSGPLDPADGLRLVHELRVHQIELELQNEELRAARTESEERLRRYTELFDFAPIGYFQLAERAVVRAVNFAGVALLGLTRAQALGQPLDTFVEPRSRTALADLLAEVLTRGDDDQPAAVRDLVLVGEGGRRLHVRATAAPLRGREPSALVAVEDVTARRVAEDALRDEVRRKDDFLAALSHELRNPLAPIRNGLFLVDRLPPADPRSRNALEMIDRQVTHLTRIVDDLLDVTRIARGKVRLQAERVDLAALLRQSIQDHQLAFDGAGVAMGAAWENGPCWIEADPARLAQVFGNVLVNALKFTPRGGRVDVLLDRAADRARVRIRDTGVGIAPDLLSRVFEPFAQAPQTLARSAGGLGLGLATVKGLVELHGGTVRARSDGPGTGTEIVIQLPLAGAPATSRPPRAGTLGAPHRVLVIEDNRDSATSLKDVLEVSGHAVRLALDGPAGLAVARDFRPEIVICDIGLPGMDGYAVARALRAVPDLRDAWLVALSGYATAEDVDRARKAGFDRHVAKPPTLAKLETLFAEAPGSGTARGKDG